MTDTLDVVDDFSQRLQADWDHTAVVAGQLDFIEQNIVDYWTKEGLPADVCHGQHPAADASRASELGLSWTLWRYAQDARSAIAEADSNRAFRVGWLMGRLDGERHMARRHGRDARSGRNSKAALPRAHESQREAIQERLAPREAENLRLDGLRPNLKDKSERARHIKAGWKKVLGLDKWVDARNSVLEDKKDKVRTLCEDRISRMLPTRK